VTVARCVREARHRLRAAGIPADEADLDARLLAQHVLGWSTERYFVDAGEPEPSAFAGQFDPLVERRAAREPFAYIVGYEEFWGLRIAVTPAVLIPRPETEMLVELALEECRAAPQLTVADVCTGSGCVAVAIAHDCGAATVVGTDVAVAALDVARQNADRHGVAGRARFVEADLFDAGSGPFDLIVANPPYVTESDYPTLQPEVREHEPALALVGGADGLAVIRRLAADAPARLRPGAALLFEFGFGQADAVAQLISSTAGLTMVGLRPDLQGIPRVAIARRA
jgi:release factor glutamine methyltransferase